MWTDVGADRHTGMSDVTPPRSCDDSSTTTNSPALDHRSIGALSRLAVFARVFPCAFLVAVIDLHPAEITKQEL